MISKDSDNSDGERPSSPTRRTADDEEGCSPAERVQVPALSSYSDNIESQLFSSFVSLAYSLALEEPQESSVVDLLDRLRHKDLGVLSTHLLTVGYGSSFVVSRFSSQDDIPDLDLIVLKRTIPTTASQSEYRVQKRVKSLMIELRVLTHDPIRKHENIIKFLGIAWETDPLDLQRKWPVLIMERATYGTLSDFLNTPGSKSPLTKLSLALDVVRGLQILHRCGVLHGDIKTDNVLVLENRDPDTQDERPIIAKLGDFSGVLFDMKDHMAIPSGTQPWNAPEWRQSLPPALLLKTDVYSLGFLIYRIMTNGKYPFRDLPKEPSWTKVETMKRDADKMLEYMKSLSVSQDNFNLKDLHAMLDQTLRNDPNLRDLNEVESILQKLTHPNRSPPDFGGLATHQIQIQDQILQVCRPYHSILTLLTHHRQLMNQFSFLGIDSLDHSIATHVASALTITSARLSSPDRATEATYGLAMLNFNGIIGPGTWSARKTEGLKLLQAAARAGSDRAQAMFARACDAFDSEIPGDCRDLIEPWLRDTASKGFFIAMEDLHSLGLKLSLEEASEALKRKHGGTGAARYSDDKYMDDNIHEFDLKLSIRVQDVQQLDSLGILNRAGDSILHFAASCSLERTLQKLMENLDSSAYNTTNIRNETPLLLACRSGHYTVTMMLLEAGADPTISSVYGDTPLHWLLSFSESRVTDVTSKLLRQYNTIDVVAQYFSYIPCGENAFIAGTPLMRAITRNRSDIVQLLLEKGADPNFTCEGASAINMAAFLHYPNILSLLLSRSTDSPKTVEKSTSKSLLIRTIMGGSLESPSTLFGRIRRHGRHWRSRAQESLQVLLDHGAGDHLHDVPGLSGLTAVFLAATYAEPDILSFLLKHGGEQHVNTFSSVPAEPEMTRTPLAAAIKTRRVETFQMLLKHGADADVKHYIPSILEPVTLLYECAWVANDEPEFAQALIDHGVMVDEAPTNYESPFACALRNRCFSLAECLLQNGADVNREYKSGLYFSRDRRMSVLGHLLAECSVATLGPLSFLFRSSRDYPDSLQRSPDFIVARDEGLTVLHVIANTPFMKQDGRADGMMLGRVLTFFEPTKELLDLTFSDKNYTALHIAVIESNLQVVRGLLAAGADASLTCEDGTSALDLGRKAVAEYPDAVTGDDSSDSLLKKSWRVLRENREGIVRLLERHASAIY